jgi:predicted porin
MQKKLIALAVAAVTSGAAFAQSNVTIYGNVDMGYMFRQGNNGAVPNNPSQHALQSGASLSSLGFKGVEDLGNGTKALFDLQYRLMPDANSTIGGAGAGHQYVGLTGGFGTVVAGYLDGIRYGIYGKYSPFGNYSIASLTSMTTQYDRAQNALAYISPSFAGFTVILATATNTQGNEGSLNTAHSLATRKPSGGNTGDDRLLSANLIYANGPLSIDLDYETTRAVSYDNSRLYVATAGASYDFGVVKVSGLYDVIKGDVNSFIGGNVVGAAFGLAADQKYDRRNWFLGASVPLGKFSVMGMFGQVKDKTLSNADAWKIGVGGRYALSKRTELYADYAHIKNDTNGLYTVGNNIGDSIGVNGLAMGIKHAF